MNELLLMKINEQSDQEQRIKDDFNFLSTISMIKIDNCSWGFCA